MTRVLRGSIILVALYSMGVFASASTISHMSAANAALSGEPGIWVQLCATGRTMFIPISKLAEQTKLLAENETDGGTPAGSTTMACHACADRRFGENPDLEDAEV